VGSDNSAIAALRLGRRFIGFDVLARYLAVAARKLKCRDMVECSGFRPLTPQSPQRVLPLFG
jgi:hypothetical protein